MKVCIYSRYAWSVLDGTQPRHGGAEHTLIRIAREIAAGGDNVVLVSIAEDRASATTRDGFDMWPVCLGAAAKGRSGGVARSLLVGAFAARFAATLLRTRADVYLCSLASKDALLVETIARLRGKPFVFRIAHDWETARDTLRERIFFGDDRLAAKTEAMLKRAALVVSQTARQQEALRANFGIESIVIPNPHYIPGEVPDFGQRRHVLWVGRAGSMKRPWLFAEMAKHLAPVPCVMIAPVDENRPDILEQLSHDAQAIPNLQLLPGVTHEVLGEYYLHAFALALTSEAEGLPNVMIEALKSGAPVVSLDVNPDGVLARDASDSGRLVGVCSNGDDERMVETLRSLATDKALWARASEDARAFARESYDIHRLVPRYRAALAGVIR